MRSETDRKGKQAGGAASIAVSPALRRANRPQGPREGQRTGQQALASLLALIRPRSSLRVLLLLWLQSAEPRFALELVMI